MDKAILKKFAIESRQDLMEKIKNKIKTFYVDEELKKEQRGDLYILSNEKHSLKLTNDEYKKRELLIKRIKELSLEQVIEEAAYTWFNRIIAIRYMEINDMLPLTKDNQSLGIRVLSSKSNTPDPEILKFTNLVNPDLDIDFKREKYVGLKDDNEKFKYVLLLVCKKLSRVIPQVFDGITDYIDILIPDNLLNDTGFITKIISDVPEENFDSVEIIGWLYQYYNQTEKDRVMASDKAYNKNEIPFATQLFTPDWIVKYMIENSLGEMWIEQSDNKSLLKNWNYYINIDKNDNKKNNKKDITSIKFIDPCCGSGHILVYAFEVFFQIYSSLGFNKGDISELILKHNLFGLDIDDRAGQLSILSIILKAREYDKYIFSKSIIKEINVLSISDADVIKVSDIDFIKKHENKEAIQKLLEDFNDAKEYGSLINPRKVDYESLIDELENGETIFLYELKNKVLPLIKCSQILSQKYDIVVTNPPYMSSKGMSNNLKKFVDKNYKAGKSDLFAAFILRCIDLLKNDGYLGMITMQSLMFLSSYTDLRKRILENSICSLLQIGFNSFPELNSQVAHAVSFVIKKGNEENISGKYYNLNVGKVNADKNKVFLQKINNDFYSNNSADMLNLPNYILAYWLSETEKDILRNYDKLEDKMQIKQGLATGNNDIYVRNWFEIDRNKIEFDASNVDEFYNSHKLYAPYNKGGNFRKWYGNKENVIKFDRINYNKLMNSGNHLPSREFYFKKGITWSLIGNENFAARISDGGFVFDVGGSSGFPSEDDVEFLLAYLCSKVTVNFLKALNPTINFQVGDIKNLPISFLSNENKEKIISLSKENIAIAKEDWDSFESSWDFKQHPFITFGAKKIEEAYKKWKGLCENRFNKLKYNEIAINQLFIDGYKLNKELSADVDEHYVSIRKADLLRDVKSLISYAVGCIFGRFSLDKEGFICTNESFYIENYKKFEADKDNIIPITEEKYFNDDIVNRFNHFVEVVFGKEYLYDNLEFIAETLGKKGTETSEDTIRRYFLNDFFNDHVKTYQKRPIYWLFDSGKKNGFKALIYMHRYNENLVPKVRLDYLHRIQTTYEKLLSDVNYKLTTDLSMNEKKAAQNRQADIMAKLNEIKEYDEKIAHIANQRISIDLDDGVKENYEKFKDILAKIK